MRSISRRPTTRWTTPSTGRRRAAAPTPAPMRNPPTRGWSMRRGTGATADGRAPVTDITTRHDAASTTRRRRFSVEATPEDTRRDAGVAAERGGERAGLAEADRQADLGDRGVDREQRLRPLDAPAGHVEQRRQAKTLLEGAREMERAEPRELGELRQQHGLGEVRLDIVGNARLLPRRQSAAHIAVLPGLAALLRRAVVEPQQLVRQQDAERLGVLLRPRCGILGLRLQLRGDR